MQQGQDDGSCTMAVSDFLRDREGEKPLGVYAMYNPHNDVQYVGYSRNMVLAVKVSFSSFGKAAQLCAHVVHHISAIKQHCHEIEWLLTAARFV